MKSFLIVKTSAIGDVIQSLSVLSVIKNRYPDAIIDWLVQPPTDSLLKAHPDINRVFVAHTRKWRKNIWKYRNEIRSFRLQLKENQYDAVFDLQGNCKSALFTFWAKSSLKVGFDLASVPEWPNALVTNRHVRIMKELTAREQYRSIVQSVCEGSIRPFDERVDFQLNQNESKQLQSIQEKWLSNPKIMICFGSNWGNKQLSMDQWKNFLSEVEKLTSSHFIFIYGNEKEQEVAEELSDSFSYSESLGKMSLPLWQNVMKECQFIISVDSAALHLAATTNTPTMSVFGPSSDKIYAPKGQSHITLMGECPFQVLFEKRCPRLRSCSTGGCMKDIPSELLFARFKNHWLSLEEREEFQQSESSQEKSFLPQ